MLEVMEVCYVELVHVFRVLDVNQIGARKGRVVQQILEVLSLWRGQATWGVGKAFKG